MSFRSDAWSNAARGFFDRVAQDSLAAFNNQIFSQFCQAYMGLDEILGRSPGKRILDAGAGSGFLAIVGNMLQWNYFGLDVSFHSLKLAKQRTSGNGFAQGDLTCLPFCEDSFEAVVALTSLEFVHEKQKALQEINRVLCSEGLFYLEVRNPDFICLKALSPMLPLARRLGIIKEEISPELKDISITDWNGLLESVGFSVVKTLPVLRPCNYGSGLNRGKNLLIGCIRRFSPVQRHYMVGMLCQRSRK